MQNSLFQEGMVWKAVGYKRLSNDDKDKEVSNSIINQEKIIKKFAERDPLIHLVGFYCDDGFTGTNFNRPSFIEMMQDIENGKANCIIVKDLSRLGREHIEVCNLIEHVLPTKGIRFIAIKENIDNYKYPARMQGFEIPLLSVVHESYAIDASKKTRANLKAKRAAGQFVTSYVPYGYMKNPEDKNQLVIDYEVSSNVEQIFNLFLEGNSIADIYRMMNQAKILCPMAYFVKKGRRKTEGEVSPLWTHANVRRILSCETYTGDLVQGKTTSYSHKVKERIALPREKWDITKAAHEPIITHKMFADVQQLLQARSRPKKSKVEPSVLSGFMVCADCGKKMVRNSQVKGGREYMKFCCATSKKYGQEVCKSHYVDEEVVIEVVLFCINNHINTLEDTDKIMNKLDTKQRTERTIAFLEKKKRQRNKDLSEYETLACELYKDYKSGLFARNEYQDMKAAFERAKEDALNEIDALTSQILEVDKLHNQYSQYAKDFLKYKSVKTLTRSMVVSMIDKILIHNERNIEIIFKYQNVYEKMQAIFDSEGKN